MTHFWADGVPLTVACDATGRPQTFTWAGSRYRVLRLAGRWRIDEGWWTERVWREYYRVTTDAGTLVLLYRDLLTDDWYLQRLYN